MTEGVMLAVLITASTIFSWLHLPQWLKNFTIKHFIISELVFTFFTYITVTSISRSIVAVVATICSGLLINVLMMGHKWMYNE